MKVTLIFPPNRNLPNCAYAALPHLAGSLGEAGHEVSVVDANLEVFERLIEPATVEWLESRFREQWERLQHARSLTPADAILRQALAKLAIVPFERLHEIGDAGRVLRNKQDFRDPEKVNRAYDTVANFLRTVYTLNPLCQPLKPGEMDNLFAHLESDFDNPISRVIEDVVLDQVLANEPDLVGVCIPFNEQLVEGMAFLKQFKRRAPHVPTIVGGAIISAYHERFCKDERFWSYADYAMPGEADMSFPDFCTTLEQGGDLTQVANLWHRDETGTPLPPPRRDLPNLNDIATPDYSVVPVHRYFLPEAIANYQTSRGCYYGKCTFCSFDIKANFRFRKAELVTQDIERIQEQTGLRHFFIWDPLTPPRLMKAIAKWNKDRGDKKIWWGAETKFEKTFTNPEFTNLIAEGGARFLQFGYESGSQRVLDLMVKGNDISRVDLMLNTLRDSGIAVSVQWFIGFPGATAEEDESSWRFLDKHRDSVLLSSYMGTYMISPDDDIFRSNGDLYDIDLFQGEDGYWDFVGRDGTEHYDREELHAAFMSRGDMESVTRMAFYVYLTEFPEDARKVSNFNRGGDLPATWADMADVCPERPDANYLSTYDFNIFEHPEQQGIGADGGVFPEAECHALFVTQTQLIYELDDIERELIVRADGTRTAAEVVEGLEGEPEVLRKKLLGFVRRGLLRVPVREAASASLATPA